MLLLRPHGSGMLGVVAVGLQTADTDGPDCRAIAVRLSIRAVKSLKSIPLVLVLAADAQDSC